MVSISESLSACLAVSIKSKFAESCTFIHEEEVKHFQLWKSLLYDALLPWTKILEVRDKALLQVELLIFKLHAWSAQNSVVLVHKTYLHKLNFYFCKRITFWYNIFLSTRFLTLFWFGVDSLRLWNPRLVLKKGIVNLPVISLWMISELGSISTCFSSSHTKNAHLMFTFN